LLGRDAWYVAQFLGQNRDWRQTASPTRFSSLPFRGVALLAGHRACGGIFLTRVCASFHPGGIEYPGMSTEFFDATFSLRCPFVNFNDN